MTGKELRKKLREEATSTVEWEYVPMIDRPLFVWAYTTGAEPREEHIAELEKENCKLIFRNKLLSDKLIDVTRLKLDLQKKNTELEVENEANENGAKKYAEFYFETNSQLTKAKELLKQWIELFKPKVSNIPPTPIQVDTEQFLKEMKK